MAGKKQPPLSRRERQIMEIVYGLGSATAADVLDSLPDPPGYSAVRAMMRILEGKGYLIKAAHEKAHVYRPAKPRQQVIGGMVRDFLDRVFDGASDALLVHLARDNKLTAKQKRIVRQLLEEKDVE